MLALLAATLSLACAREEMVPDVPSAGPVLNIDGSIAQVPTRATGSGFEDGDALGLYAVNWTENNTVAGTLAAQVAVVHAFRSGTIRMLSS